MTSGPYKPFKPLARYILQAAYVAYVIGGCVAFGVLVGLGLVPMIIAAVERLP